MERNTAIWSSRNRKDFLCQSLCHNGQGKILLSFLSRSHEQVLRWVWEACLRSFWAGMKKPALDHFYWWNWLYLRQERRGRKWVIKKSKEWVLDSNGRHWSLERTALHNCRNKSSMVNWQRNFEKIWEKSLHSFAWFGSTKIHGWEKA